MNDLLGDREATITVGPIKWTIETRLTHGHLVMLGLAAVVAGLLLLAGCILLGASVFDLEVTFVDAVKLAVAARAAAWMIR